MSDESTGGTEQYWNDPETPHRVYLAGPMNHVGDHGRGWREHLTENESSGIEYLNPLDLNDEYDFDPTEPVPTWVIDEDLEMVEAADTVLAWLPFETPSRGTAVEIWEAGKDPDTFVVVWSDVPEKRFSPFVRGPADAFAGSMKGALSRIREAAEGGDCDV